MPPYKAITCIAQSLSNYYGSFNVAILAIGEYTVGEYVCVLVPAAACSVQWFRYAMDSGSGLVM